MKNPSFLNKDQISLKDNFRDKTTFSEIIPPLDSRLLQTRQFGGITFFRNYTFLNEITDSVRFIPVGIGDRLRVNELNGAWGGDVRDFYIKIKSFQPAHCKIGIADNAWLFESEILK